jgi:alpha-galactosidase
MLEVGNGLTDAENRAHFSLWCLVKSPLLLGMDLTKMTPAIKAVVSNMNLIRIHQDPHARQATCFHGCSEKADWSILATAVTGGDTIVCIVNWSDTPKSIQHFAAHTVGVVLGPNQVLAVRDLWTNEQLKDKFDYQTAKKIPVPTLEPHDCVIYQLSTKDICKDSVVDPACVE